MAEPATEVPTEPGDTAGSWASLVETAQRSLSDEERKRLHDLTAQKHLYRGRQAMLLGTFATIALILVGVGLLLAARIMTVPEAKDLLTILLPPLFTLLGAAGTLYFARDAP
ncbi:MAG TPA: hypothetical protein VHT30_09110 [Acidimicrobiales bacterium]|jgi:hypothetical protein|nr:hypothetical protein [Acidimicrobiales bacterium]